jgi:hypothetical protein
MKEKGKEYFEDYKDFNDCEVIARTGPTDLRMSNKALIDLVKPDFDSKKPRAYVEFCNKAHTKALVIENKSGSIRKLLTVDISFSDGSGGWWFGEDYWNGGKKKPGTNLKVKG